MTDTLFSDADVYAGDPLRPDKIDPTPAEVVGRLTGPQRVQRVEWLTQQALDIYNESVAEHLGKRTLIASCVLFSGGNDSTTLAHLFVKQFGIATHAVHANTTIGIEQTRQYVRDTCKAWDLPLIEVFPPQSFRELVLEHVKGKPRGFPGPGAHWFAYARLKERALDRARHELGVANSRSKAIVNIAGRRRQESDRRSDIPLSESDGTAIWTSPIALWTKPDLNTYRLMHPDVPRNEVSDLLHMSGECLCGAFAHPGELDEIGLWFPEVKAEIEQLQDDARAAGADEPYCLWGHGRGAPSNSGRLCSSCKPPSTDQMTFGDST